MMKKIFVLFTAFFIFLATGAIYADSSVEGVHHHRTRILLKNNLPPVNINHANVDDLATLKGIGPKKAQAIIDYRNTNGDFKSLDDLTHIKGIGKKTLARLEKNNPGRIVIAENKQKK